MKRVFSILLCLIAFSINSQSQTGRCGTLMKNVAEKHSKTTGILITFTMKIKSGEQITNSSSGNIKLRGVKFALSTPEMECCYNGKEAWSYLKSGNEVNLTKPDENDLININPYILLRDYKKRFDCSYGGKQDNIETVILKPISKTDEIVSVKIAINGKNLAPTRIEVINKNGLKTVVNITEFRTEMGFDNSVFVFDPKKHPNTEIIDLK